MSFRATPVFARQKHLAIWYDNIRAMIFPHFQLFSVNLTVPAIFDEDSYFNMKEKIEPHMHLVDSVLSVYEKLDIQPKVVPIRGGTDGARLSYMGLPCPNLGTGDHNCHGHFEFVCVQSMEKCVEVIVELGKRYAEFEL